MSSIIEFEVSRFFLGRNELRTFETCVKPLVIDKGSGHTYGIYKFFGKLKESEVLCIFFLYIFMRPTYTSCISCLCFVYILELPIENKGGRSCGGFSLLSLIIDYMEGKNQGILRRRRVQKDVGILFIFYRMCGHLVPLLLRVHLYFLFF